MDRGTHDPMPQLATSKNHMNVQSRFGVGCMCEGLGTCGEREGYDVGEEKAFWGTDMWRWGSDG